MGKESATKLKGPMSERCLFTGDRPAARQRHAHQNFAGDSNSLQKKNEGKMHKVQDLFSLFSSPYSAKESASPVGMRFESLCALRNQAGPGLEPRVLALQRRNAHLSSSPHLQGV